MLSAERPDDERWLGSMMSFDNWDDWQVEMKIGKVETGHKTLKRSPFIFIL